MRLVDAYRRIHPKTSDSDESTVHSSDYGRGSSTREMYWSNRAMARRRPRAKLVGAAIAGLKTHPSPQTS